MDINAEMGWHNAICYGGVGKPVNVQVTLLLARVVRNLQHEVQEAICSPGGEVLGIVESSGGHSLDDRAVASDQEAMLGWPKMGTAIAKLVWKVFLLAMKEATALKRCQLYKCKQMSKEPMPAPRVG